MKRPHLIRRSQRNIAVAFLVVITLLIATVLTS